MPRRLIVAIVTAAAFVAAGCGTATPSRPVDRVLQRPAQPTVVPRDPCADWNADLTKHSRAPRWKREPLPAGFTPVLLITCDLQERTTAATGEWTYRVEKRATRGLESVVAALRSTLPPPPSGSYGCTTELRLDPWFLLIDSAGRVVLPAVPHDRACDQPIDVGLERLDYTITSATKVRQQSTPAELATGCTDQWKNEPRIAVDMGASRPARTRQVVSERPTSVCTYASGHSEVGRFIGGARLTQPDATRIGHLLAGGPAQAGSSCPPADDFALIHTTGGNWVYVELTGCHRLVVSEGSLYTAPVPDLVIAIRDLKLQH